MSEDNLLESFLLYPIIWVPGIKFKVTRTGSKRLYLLKHLGLGVLFYVVIPYTALTYFPCGWEKLPQASPRSSLRRLFLQGL